MSYNKFLKIKKRLKFTWNPFFGQFGKLLPVQLETIPLVLEKKNLIVSSSTASGKTEAVIAPLVERFIREKWEGFAILYISPTRALVNDMDRRLLGLLTNCNITMSVKTGDRPQFNPNSPTDMLITTPESLDSLICRHPKIFNTLKAIIIDEIHLLDNTYRGDQLILLLRRLKELVYERFNIYALSATIANCEEIGKRYLKTFDIVNLESSRKIIFTLIPEIKILSDYLRKENLKKILIFCNARKRVEALALECKELNIPIKVLAHHGSLSKAEREETEKFMKTSESGICVSTMTLEIGIDIGDIDAVVIADIPWTISSLLQRIGRGNRRTDSNRAFGIYWSKEKNKSILEKMFGIAIKGGLENIPYKFNLSVVIQQLFSCLWANRSGLEVIYFNKLFEEICNIMDLKEILNSLEDKGWILKKYEKYYASEKLMNSGEYGFIHSNIPEESSMKVIDISNQRAVGHILFPVDNIFVLAGKIWKIVKIRENSMLVRKIKSTAYLPEFELRDNLGKYFYFLPEKIRKKQRLQAFN